MFTPLAKLWNAIKAPPPWLEFAVVVLCAANVVVCLWRTPTHPLNGVAALGWCIPTYLWYRSWLRSLRALSLWDATVTFLATKALAVTESREPDQIIAPAGREYLFRWYLTPWRHIDNIKAEERTRWQKFLWFLRLPNVYVHLFTGSDDDRALHDHPWANCSIVLIGGYVEIREDGARTKRGIGDVVFRWAKTSHRIEMLKEWDPTLYKGYESFPREMEYQETPFMSLSTVPALTLFITGFKTRSWGFWCPGKRWVPWREFTDPTDTGKIGKGCD